MGDAAILAYVRRCVPATAATIRARLVSGHPCGHTSDSSRYRGIPAKGDAMLTGWFVAAVVALGFVRERRLRQSNDIRRRLRA